MTFNDTFLKSLIVYTLCYAHAAAGSCVTDLCNMLLSRLSAFMTLVAHSNRYCTFQLADLPTFVCASAATTCIALSCMLDEEIEVSMQLRSWSVTGHRTNEVMSDVLIGDHDTTA